MSTLAVSQSVVVNLAVCWHSRRFALAMETEWQLLEERRLTEIPSTSSCNDLGLSLPVPNPY